MRKFIKNSIYFSLPFLIWAIFVFIIDPFNYFNKIHLVDNNAKVNAENLNTLLYRTIDFFNYPSNNILIGDSRTDALPKDLIETYSKKKFKKLNTNATKINEIFDLFYLVNETHKLDQVVIGVNFSMFNKYSYQNRIESLERIIKNPLLYIYNIDTIEASFFVIRSLILNKNLNSKPSVDKESFWEWTINVKGEHWYGKYDFPKKIYNELFKFDNFTHDNNIDVVFIIIPHHVDFNKKLFLYGLEKEKENFKNIMSNLHAKVFDFDFKNSITTDKNNFVDPIHYNDSIGKVIVKEIWNNQLLIGKKL